MMQRTLLVTAIAGVGLAGLLLGEPERLAAILPVVGFVSVSGQAVLLAASLVVVFFGALDLAQGSARSAFPVALLAVLLMLGLALAGLALATETARWLPVAILVVVLPVVLLIQPGVGKGSIAPALVAHVYPLLIYIAALLLFTGIYATRWRAFYVAPAIGVSGALLALLWWRATSEARAADEGAAAFVVGLALAQAAWALLFWPAPALIAGLALLAVFYAGSGVIAAVGRGALRKRLAAEYAGVGLAVFAVVLWAVLRGS
jgi:hypothetical protein